MRRLLWRRLLTAVSLLFLFHCQPIGAFVHRQQPRRRTWHTLVVAAGGRGVPGRGGGGPPAGGPPPGTFRINGESVEPGKGPLKPPKLTGKKAKKAKIAKQRAGSAGESGVRSTGKAIADQAVRVEMARRGDKQVTMVRGLETPAEDRKALLKLLKSKIGVGGTLDKASGIIEIQGPHGAKVTELLVKAGYSSAKQSGKKK
jgi:translation initiation factor 1